MKVGNVIGKVSLSKVHHSLVGKRWVVAVLQNLPALTGRKTEPREELIVLDEIGATPGAQVGVADGAEAAFPFYPEKKPVDAYLACILDDLQWSDEEVDKLL